MLTVPFDNVVKVAIYVRVSTQEQAEEGTSLEYQEQQLRNHCQAQGWQIFHCYKDAGHTGKDDNRPELQHMLSDARLNFFTKLIVYKLDRLSRKLKLLLDLEERLKDTNVALLSVKETIDTSVPTGRLVFHVLGLVGEWEREAIVERTRSGRLQRFREGLWAGGKPPYGYSHNKLTRKLEINEVEAVIVCRIFNDYVSGKSLNRIANSINSDKVRPRSARGKGWRETAVRNIIINPVYKRYACSKSPRTYREYC